jgi:hypothetical protein
MAAITCDHPSCTSRILGPTQPDALAAARQLGWVCGMRWGTRTDLCTAHVDDVTPQAAHGPP